jgi:ATP-dependent Zn protease
MDPRKILITLFFLFLAVSGSWYFEAYSNKEYTPDQSSKHFQEGVSKAEQGMNDKERKAYEKTAGLDKNQGI